MTRFVRLDVHKREVEVCVMDARGKVLRRERRDRTRESLEHLARRVLKKGDHVALGGRDIQPVGLEAAA